MTDKLEVILEGETLPELSSTHMGEGHVLILCTTEALSADVGVGRQTLSQGLQWSGSWVRACGVQVQIEKLDARRKLHWSRPGVYAQQWGTRDSQAAPVH